MHSKSDRLRYVTYLFGIDGTMLSFRDRDGEFDVELLRPLPLPDIDFDDKDRNQDRKGENNGRYQS